MLCLYQMPISHYCEKVRWALDYKGLAYRKENLLPGLHIKQARRLSGRSSLPILFDHPRAIHESTEILDYLEEKFPDKPLTPKDPRLAEAARKWEHFADTEIGPHVRRVCYDVLLEHPRIVIPFFTKGGPWYGRILMRIMFKKLRKKMKIYMKIDDLHVAASRDQLVRAVDKVRTAQAKTGFLVGDSFTRADLTVAALLAPLRMPEKYGLNWPKNHPPELASLLEIYAEKTAWVDELYRRFR